MKPVPDADELVTQLRCASRVRSPEYIPQHLSPQDCKLAAAEIERLRAAHSDIVKMYEKMMGKPPDWTAFKGDQLTWVREAWYGAAKISRRALEQREDGK